MDWQVELPDKNSARPSWGSRPRGLLRIESESHGSETISLPLAVARSLDRKQRSGELDPSSRAELLYQVGQISASKAMDRIAKLVDRRDYSSKEATDKLRQDGYTPSVVDATVARASDAHLIDDRRFAEVFVRTKVYAGWGMRRIERELSRRGIEAQELPGWPYDYLDPEGERERALEVARRHRVSGKNQLQKMVRFLMGRGFPTGVSYDVAREVLEDD